MTAEQVLFVVIVAGFAAWFAVQLVKMRRRWRALDEPPVYVEGLERHGPVTRCPCGTRARVVVWHAGAWRCPDCTLVFERTGAPRRWSR